VRKRGDLSADDADERRWKEGREKRSKIGIFEIPLNLETLFIDSFSSSSAFICVICG
jgi:hypothetical protein